MDPATDWVASGGKVALDFDGGDDNVSFPLPQTNGLTAASFSLWANFNSVANTAIGARICGKWESGGLSWLIAQKDNAGQKWLFAAFNASLYTLYETTNNVLATGTWTHLAAIYTAPSARLFMNGLEVASTAVLNSSTSIASSSLTCKLGRCDTADSAINGKLDDIRIYNTSIPTSEIGILGLRRGISYETTRQRRGRIASAPTGSTKNNMLIGCGF
jgi:hypothetical protein